MHTHTAQAAASLRGRHCRPMIRWSGLWDPNELSAGLSIAEWNHDRSTTVQQAWCALLAANASDSIQVVARSWPSAAATHTTSTRQPMGVASDAQRVIQSIESCRPIDCIGVRSHTIWMHLLRAYRLGPSNPAACSCSCVLCGRHAGRVPRRLVERARAVLKLARMNAATKQSS